MTIPLWQGALLFMVGLVVGGLSIFEYMKAEKSKAAKIEALWCDEEDYSWTFQTKIPHANFEVMEDGEKYCRGIVFSLSEVK